MLHQEHTALPIDTDAVYSGAELLHGPEVLAEAVGSLAMYEDEASSPDANDQDAEPVFDEALYAEGVDTVRVYLNSIGRIALLSAKEEVELAKRIEAGLYAQHRIDAARNKDGQVDKAKLPASLHELQKVAAEGAQAKTRMIEANLRLVVTVAKRMRRFGMSLQDRIQDGNAGLIHAVEKFDYTKGYKFSTYAVPWIKQAIRVGNAEQVRAVRIPINMLQEVDKVINTKTRLSNKLGREPTFEEIGKEIGVSATRVKELYDYDQTSPISLHAPVDHDGGGESVLADFIEDGDVYDAMGALDWEARREAIASALVVLTPGERVVVRSRLGLLDGQPLMGKEIAEILGVSPARIGQLWKSACKRLRSSPEVAALLHEYFTEAG